MFGDVWPSLSSAGRFGRRQAPAQTWENIMSVRGIVLGLIAGLGFLLLPQTTLAEDLPGSGTFKGIYHKYRNGQSRFLFFAVPDPTVKIPVPITRFWRNEVTIKTSYGAAPDDLNESFQILTQKKLDVKSMITHRLGIRQAAEGFRLMAEADKSLKVILEPNAS